MDIRWSNWAIYIEIIIPIWFIESIENTTTPFRCERERNEGCCDGYFRDPEGNNCTKCGPGYFGPNCTLICPYPTYGDECQEICDCDNKTCDISTGCRIPTTVEFTSSTFSETLHGTTLTIKGNLINLIKIFGGVDIL
uniref:Platelet endothelial aggregation receptor 1-like n=1 Tax=Crassostrea virginica TaxID=6565 RepID=A0A8B8A9F0_CRAVI|nr:platelet endothelial aggregation receptor 1-like [Crassostrea virginica]